MADLESEGSLVDSHLRLFETGNFADATIVCRGREWNVHKLVLGSRCEWFRKALYGPMLEATTGTIRLDDEDPDLIDVLLRYIYTRDVKIPKHIDAPVVYVRLFRMGDFFLLKGMKERVIKGLWYHLDSKPVFIDTVPGYGQNREWVADVLQAVEEAYMDDSTKEIRKIVLDFIYLNMRNFFQSPAALDLLRTTPAMATHLIETQISGEVDKRSRWPSRFGLTVLAAVSQDFGVYEWYDPELGSVVKLKGTNKEPVGEDWGPYLLYPDVHNSDYYQFTVVDFATEKVAVKMQSLAPPASRVERMRTSPGCDVVEVQKLHYKEKNHLLYLCFASCDKANVYAQRYYKANKKIVWETQPSCNLGDRMRQVVEYMRQKCANV